MYDLLLSVVAPGGGVVLALGCGIWDAPSLV
jgi:hypothetical protein